LLDVPLGRDRPDEHRRRGDGQGAVLHQAGWAIGRGLAARSGRGPKGGKRHRAACAD
jgi:hypothetical protein